MWGRLRRKKDRRGEAIEQALSALGSAWGRLGMMRATRRRRDHGNAIGVGIGLVLVAIVISLLSLLLRRKARGTTPATSVPEEGGEVTLPATEVVEEDEEITTPVTEVVPDEMAEAAEYVPPREEPPPGEERPEKRGVTPVAPPASREEPSPGEERPERRMPEEGLHLGKSSPDAS